MRFLFNFLIALMSLSALSAESQYPPLIPHPRQVEWKEGYFRLSEDVAVKSHDKNLESYILQRIEELTGIRLSVHTGDGAVQTIEFIIDPAIEPAEKEAYALTVTDSRIQLTGSDPEGIFRGIQTFLQLIPPDAKFSHKATAVPIRQCVILDKPKFVWRGLNLDCARHFMTKDFIKRYIDILAYYKFNIFHWHLTEDQGWRIEIKKYPDLTAIGAWRTEADGSVYGGYYTQDDIREIVTYAESRYITVVPEIEMPGHSLASLASYPENSCTGGPFEVANYWGVIRDVYCAGRDSTFIFLKGVLDEVLELFPGEYVHIGGDEVPKDRWQECPRCQERIKTEGLRDEEELQSYFIKRISKYLNARDRTIIGWDEILQGGLAPGSIVQSWQGVQGAVEAARLGHYAINSPTSHTYLNHDPEDLDLRIAYSFKPVPDELSDDQRKFILGSEANLWTEFTPQELVDSRLFPRLLALAEVFWTSPDERDYDEFYSRVRNAYTDLQALGITYGRESKAVTYTTSYDEEKKSFTIQIVSVQDDVRIRYTRDGSEPDENSPLYKEPIAVDKSSSLHFAAFRNGHFIGKKFNLSFDFHLALNGKLKLLSPYDERYRAGGDHALIDGVRGTDNFRDGAWQGYEGIDFEAIIDLGEEKRITKVVPRFILNSTSWIFLPENVSIALSNDPDNFQAKQTVRNDVVQKNPEIVLKDFPVEFDSIQARYIKVSAESIKVCPEWHPAAGGKAWLFIDEIVVE